MSTQAGLAPPLKGNVPVPQASVGFSGLTTRKKRWDTGIPWFNFPKDAYCTLRFFGPVFSLRTHWIPHKKSGKRFPLICPCSNVLVETTEDDCPIEKDFDPYNSEVEKIKELQAKSHAYAHAIVRNSTDNPPWKPVKVALSVLMELQKKKGLNKCLIDGVTYEADLSDPYWGRDVNIFYDSQTSTPSQTYSLDLGDHTPLTDVELSYMDSLYDWPNIIQYPTYNEVKEAVTSNGFYQLLQGGTSIYVPPAAQAAAATQAKEAIQSQVKTPAPPPPVAEGGFGNAPAAPAQPPGYMPPPPTAPAPVEAPTNVPPAPVASPVEPAPESETNPEPPGALPEDEIPFSQASEATDKGASEATDLQPVPEKKWIVKGKPDGVSTEEFQKIIMMYCDNAKMERARPAKTWTDGELHGFNVLQCYGHYRGDIGCVKCPLRQRCLHEHEK